MTMSSEFRFGLDLIKRFDAQLRGIAEARTEEEAKELIESIKHPIFGAMAQIKVGGGPMKEEILKPLAVVVSQFRELTNLEALKGAILEVLDLVQRAEKLEEETAKREA